MFIEQFGFATVFTNSYINRIIITHINGANGFVTDSTSKFTNFGFSKVRSTCSGRSPNCIVLQGHDQVIIVFCIAVPGCTSIHIQIGRIASITLPFCSITHPQVEAAKVTRCYAPARACIVITIPVGIFSIQTYINGTQSTHTAYGREVADNLSYIVACSCSCRIISVFSFSYIHINNATIFGSKFTISTNCNLVTTTKVGIASTIILHDDFATANFNSGSYRRQAFAHALTFGNIAFNIHKTINFNPVRIRIVTHALDAYATVRRSRMSTNYNSVIPACRSAIFAAIMDMDMTAGFYEQACCHTTSIGVNSNLAGIVDVNLCILACGNTGLCRFEHQFIAIQINRQRISAIVIRNNCIY